MSWIYMLLIGGVAGYIVERVMKRDDSVLVNIGLGIAGSFVGGMIFRLIGINFDSLLGSLICATAGAFLLVFLYNKFRK